jgi:outer membrane protein TolC
MNVKNIGVAIAMAVMVPGSVFGATITLKDYVNQVVKTHIAVEASRLNQEGGELISKQANLYTSPTLFASAQFLNDGKPYAFPVPFERVENTSAQAGLRLKTDWGSQFTVSYALSTTALRTPTGSLFASYGEAAPTVEFVKNLWKNANGEDVKSAQKVAVLSSDITSLTEILKVKGVATEAELAYWRLALANETVEAHQKSLARSEKMKGWASNRANLQLSDNSDFYQAEALYELRQIELQSALDERKIALHRFNLLRSQPEDAPANALAPLEVGILKNLDILQTFEPKEDVRVLEAQQKITQANLIATKQNYEPTLDFAAKMTLNQKEPQLSDAVSKSFNNKYGTYQVSLTYSMNLDMPSLSDIVKGYDMQAQAQKLSYDVRLAEQEQDWKDLTQQFNDAKRRYESLKRLEGIQRTKWTYETDRRSKGRTTTFQVLQFEQDYATAQLNTLKALSDILRLAAQLKTFGSY